MCALGIKTFLFKFQVYVLVLRKLLFVFLFAFDSKVKGKKCLPKGGSFVTTHIGIIVQFLCSSSYNSKSFLFGA